MQWGPVNLAVLHEVHVVYGVAIEKSVYTPNIFFIKTGLFVDEVDGRAFWNYWENWRHVA